MILLLAILLGLIPAVIAEKKGRSFIVWWLFGALLFIVALPLAILLENKTIARNSGVKHCPYCGQALPVKEMECPNCHRAQPVTATSDAEQWQKTVAAADDVEKWAKNRDSAGQNSKMV